MALHKTKIGKDVIESLTLGMYDDSRFVYREYVQNSVDQIDIAVEMGIINSQTDGFINIDINKSEHTITITDNATGIIGNQVEEVLKNIAYSPKDIEKHRGFRGIGRLGGLGYCDCLIFETSSKGENIKSTLKWDAKNLKQIIYNRKVKEEASDIIDRVTEYYTSQENPNKHYFKVILEGVENKILLNKEKIREYLSMVAPVPFNKGFIFKSKIDENLDKIGNRIDEYKIYVNADQLYKEYTKRIYEGEPTDRKSIDEIIDIEFFTINSPSDNELITWGWYSITNFKKQIPGRANPARGIRLRKGNIQIGSERTLIKLFKEQRGNFYFFGEVHILSNQLIPNARRDYFEENGTLIHLEEELRSLFHDRLDKLYRLSSKIRNIAKRIDDAKKFAEEYQNKKATGFTNKQEKKKYEEKLNDKIERAETAEKELNRIKEKTEISSPQEKIFKNITSEVAEIDLEKIKQDTDNDGDSKKFATDELTQLNRKERKVVSRIFSIISNILTPDLAQNLIDKIKEEFK